MNQVISKNLTGVQALAWHYQTEVWTPKSSNHEQPIFGFWYLTQSGNAINRAIRAEKKSKKPQKKIEHFVLGKKPKNQKTKKPKARTSCGPKNQKLKTPNPKKKTAKIKNSKRQV